MKVVFNVKLRNVFRVICMEEADLGNQQQFLEKGNKKTEEIVFL